MNKNIIDRFIKYSGKQIKNTTILTVAECRKLKFSIDDIYNTDVCEICDKEMVETIIDRWIIHNTQWYIICCSEQCATFGYFMVTQ